MTSFLFLDNNGKKIKKNLSKVLNTFENVKENGACSIFHIISKYVVFQRFQKALLWSIGLSKTLKISYLLITGSPKERVLS